jgi:hypothetical protein
LDPIRQFVTGRGTIINFPASVGEVNCVSNSGEGMEKFAFFYCRHNFAA